MTKKIIPFLFIFAFVVAAVWLGRPAAGDRPAAGEAELAAVELAPSALPLQTPELFHDFGEVSMRRGNVEYKFILRNESAEPVHLRDVYTSCMCTTAILTAAGQARGPFGMPGHGPLPKANLTLAPNETLEVRAIFDPAAHGPAGVGRVTREIYLADDAGRQLVLSFAAVVTP